MFENSRVVFEYFVGNEKKVETFKTDFENGDFKTIISWDNVEGGHKYALSIMPKKEIVIEKLYVEEKYSYSSNSKIYVNGYQSWTDSREFFVDENLKDIAWPAKLLNKKYNFKNYGDYTFTKYSKRKGDFHGFTYSYIRNDEELTLIGSLTERNGYTIIKESVKDGLLIIEKECQGLHIDSKYNAFELVSLNGEENFVFDKYFEYMGVNKPKGQPMTGWTSWYNYYQDISEDIILENLNNFSEMNKNIEIYQIDDGFQTAVGDWLSIDKNKFPRGMKPLVDEIKAKGYKSGLWLAPFSCETNSEIFKNKKHWILKDKNGNLVHGGNNWSGFYALDLYNAEVREYIRKVFDVVLNEWGFDMVKLDFLYSVCLVPRRDKTRGQVMTEAMEFLRECVGDKLILGCGVPLGPAFGLVDYCRIGCDVGLDWNDTVIMQMTHRERISTLNAINNTIGRKHLDGRAFFNDPDVFLLREDNIKLTREQKKTLSVVNYIFGSLLFTSDNISKYDKGHHNLFDGIMQVKEKEILSVDRDKEGFVKVLYLEENIKHLALINLSEKETVVKNSYGKLTEVSFDEKANKEFNDRNIAVQGFESRIFVV